MSMLSQAAMLQRFALVFVVLSVTAGLHADEQEADRGSSTAVLQSVEHRFASSETSEVPDFQRHVSPLLGRLGCNGRACHGSFQGRGGFRLSLFGYDFTADHEALTGGETPRVNREQVDESLMLRKPLNGDLHEGGQRFSSGQWQHHLLRRWVASGATYEKGSIKPLKALEVTPAEIVVEEAGVRQSLRVVAVWEDGTREDVTPLCRFQTNDEQIAKIDEEGNVVVGSAGDTHVVVFYDNGVAPVPVVHAVSKQRGEKYPAVATSHPIDALVVDKLKKLGVVPSELCSDAEFLRRVSLDIAGTLPTAAEVEAFLADPSSTKRAAKIDQLLETKAYAAWWTTRLCDFTGNNDQRLNNVNGIQGNGAKDWYDWIYQRVERNEPYDRLMAGIVLGVSRNPDESYAEYCEAMSSLYRKGAEKSFADRHYMPHYWARRNFTSAEDRAIGFAYSFLGIRIQCAQCHKHPFDQWSKDDFDQFKSFFTAVTGGAARPRPDAKKEYEAMLASLEINEKQLKGNDRAKKFAELLKADKVVPFGEIYIDRARLQGNRRGRNATPAATKAKLLGGEVIDLSQTEDPREPLMQWLRSPDNRYFAKAFVNRVWAGYFHAGIVNPPDDLSLANPPSNGPLLDHLARSFVEHGFDMKWLHREICNSDTYQRSWRANSTNEQDERNFSRAVPRRLPAEVAVDALAMATASDTKGGEMLSVIATRAIGIPGSSGRNDRGNNQSTFALQVFGRSSRESNCDCDRSMDASLLQTVYLQNDASVLAAIAGAKDTWIEQLSRELKAPAPVATTPSGPNRKAMQAQLEKFRQRLAQAKKAGGEGAGQAEQVARLEARIASLEKALPQEDAEPETEPVGKAKAPTAASDRWNDLIKQTYLRTVSRYPTPEETERCRR
ncbi:MAG: hypothetical protein RIS70_2840, partial [Planctomycetota bacterium]